MEKEKDDQLPFVDILLRKSGHWWLHQHLGMPQGHTHQSIPGFQSHHPLAHKRAVVWTLMCRAESLSSSAVILVEEEKHVVEALHKNGYSNGFIRKPCRTCLHADMDSQQDSEAHMTLTLPCICGLSESIRRILSPLSIWISFHPFKT